MMDESNVRETLSDAARLESLLFVASEPVSTGRLARALGTTETSVEEALAQLELEYDGRGISVQRSQKGIQLTTAPAAASLVERFLNLEQFSRLSQAALEVLSIVAYRQPVTRPEVDSIRGVNSDGALRTLLARGLVEEVGRMETPGRPILYGTTLEFLQYFGLSSPEELPVLEDPVEPELAQQDG